MTPGDTLPPPSRHIEPPISIGTRGSSGGRTTTTGRIFQCVSLPTPGWGVGGRRAVGRWRRGGIVVVLVVADPLWGAGRARPAVPLKRYALNVRDSLRDSRYGVLRIC